MCPQGIVPAVEAMSFDWINENRALPPVRLFKSTRKNLWTSHVFPQITSWKTTAFGTIGHCRRVDHAALLHPVLFKASVANILYFRRLVRRSAYDFVCLKVPTAASDIPKNLPFIYFKKRHVWFRGSQRVCLTKVFSSMESP